MDPQPVVSWFRLGTFINTVGMALVALDSVSPEVKSITVIVMLVVNGALTAFFPTTAAESPAARVIRKLMK